MYSIQTFGCGSAIASSSLATEKLKGKTLEEAAKLTNKEIAAELLLPPVKLHCSMLAEEAVKVEIVMKPNYFDHCLAGCNQELAVKAVVSSKDGAQAAVHFAHCQAFSKCSTHLNSSQAVVDFS